MAVGTVCPVGQTPYGTRTVSIITDGVVSGSGFHANVISGGLDFELELSNGVIEVEQVFVLRADDGQTIYLHCMGVGKNGQDVRVVMDFEAALDGSCAELLSGSYVARRSLDLSSMTMKLTVYDVSGVARGKCVSIEKPSDCPFQPQSPPKAVPGTSRSDKIISEKVMLGPWCTTGGGKRGTRNIIPIHGGEFFGDLEGVVLHAGADYQLQTEDAFTLDARYLWQTNDGEIIIVRNAGSFGALVPIFETRVDGPYAWLNSGSYQSGDPEVGDGFVRLHLYKAGP